MKAIRIICLTCGVFLTFSFSAPAQEFPTKPITFILVLAPGGTSDTTSKAIIEGMKRQLKGPIVPKYVIGSGGARGAYELSKAKPDGYTIGNTTGVSMAFVPHIEDVHFNPTEDFDFIGTYAQAIVGTVVRSDSPFKTVKDLVEAARKNPGQIRFGNSNPRGWMGLAPSYLEKVEKIQFKIVPFPGGSTVAMTSLLGGHIDFMCANPPAIIPFLNSGHIRMIASNSDMRHSDLSVPTLREQGYDFDQVSWIAAGAPKGLPVGVRKRLEMALKEAVKDADYVKFMEKTQQPIDYHDGEDYKKIIEKYYKKWGELLKDGYRY